MTSPSDTTSATGADGAAASPEAAAPVRGSVFALKDFRYVFAAGATSKFGTQISYLAVPLLAVTELDASSGQVGALAALSTVAFLLIGLPAGAWVDRMRRRRLQITADVVRAALFGSIPVAWWLDALTLYQLYAVVLIGGVATVFFDVSNQSFLPHVVGRERLGEANARLMSAEAVNSVAGRGAGGYLVQLITAPLAIGVNAATYVVSALCLLRVRRPEPAPKRQPGRHLGREILEGARFVLGHPLLRPIALEGAATNLAVQMSLTLLPVLFVRELRLSEGVLGAYLGLGGVGAFLGSLCARAIGRKLGHGRAMWVIGLAVAPMGCLIARLDRGPALWAAALAWLAITFKIGSDNVIKVTARQELTPDHLLGRMNATFRFLVTGALAVGSLLAGLLGEFAGLRAALWTGAGIMAVSWLLIFFSPLRSMKELPKA
ncbi:MFS transporter [Streptomyces albireticuli]|uniref:MFS transporter n=1 Tax=Streptomyces albireticuli TaxID=1940 RepID=A0A1Z2L3J9_9ACTN|nr:MFS transporter [Streptomyces albireticuli]ARZ68866.1 MFS transporter [Streptomyces albireticuli]